LRLALLFLAVTACFGTASILWHGDVAAQPVREGQQQSGPRAVHDEATAAHPHFTTPLTAETTFPRFTPEELQKTGYPDHMHAFYWNDWVRLRDEEGGAYGPGTMCHGGRPIERPDLIVEPGHMQFGQIDLHYNPGYRPCQLILFVELCDYARVRIKELLGIERTDTLSVVNPDNTDAYREMTGNGVWRTFQLDGNDCVVEPIPVLIARTLIGHSVVELMTFWYLDHAVGDALPPWLAYGLVNYVADMGAHLNNYMAQFRVHGPVLLHPDEVDTILAGGPLPDDGEDRRLFRMASYSAFLMVWHLVEHNGGLEKIRKLLDDVSRGDELEDVVKELYGRDLPTLVGELDPHVTGEPIGDAIAPTAPHKPPFE
jgi:hypothetical protein